MELNVPSVGVKQEGMDFNTQGGSISNSPDEFHQWSIPSPIIANQHKLELNLGFSLGNDHDVTFRRISGGSD